MRLAREEGREGREKDEEEEKKEEEEEERRKWWWRRRIGGGGASAAMFWGGVSDEARRENGSGLEPARQDSQPDTRRGIQRTQNDAGRDAELQARQDGGQWPGSRVFKQSAAL